MGPAQTEAVANATFPRTSVVFSLYFFSLNSFCLVINSTASGATKPIPAITGFTPRTA